MRFTKEKLLSLIKENIDEMAMDFDTQDRPDQGLQNTLQTGDTPLKKIPFPKTGDEPNKNFQELLASERYRQVVSRIREYTGLNTSLNGMEGMMPLAQMMQDAHNQIIRIEQSKREELEQLAIELVVKEMSIPEGAFNFDAKIVGMGEIDTDDFNNSMEQQQNIDPVDVEKDLFTDLEQLNLEKAKRRLINSMVQGASKRGHYMYHLVGDRIREITGSENLISLYGVLMSINDTLYWQISDEQMQMMMGGGGGEASIGGKESVDRNTTPPTIIARAVNFPILVHELIKGVMEVFAIQGRPEDEEGYDEVEDSEDTLKNEMWDLRLGPAIWDRIRSQFPDEIIFDNTELQNYLFVEIFKLPAKKFLVLMKEVISQTERGKKLLEEIVEGIKKMLNDQDYEDVMSQFESDLDDATQEAESENFNFDDFLNSMGIRRSDDTEDDDEDDGGELVPVR
jgi:hypothetical protein